MLGCFALASVLVEPPPVQRPKSMEPVAPPEAIEPEPEPFPPPEPIVPLEPIAPEPIAPEPIAPEPRAPAEFDDPVAAPPPPPTISDPFAGPPPARKPDMQRTVDPFSDGRPTAPERDGKALLYGGFALSAIAIGARAPVSAILVLRHDPVDALIFGNMVNVVAAGAIAAIAVGAVRRGRALAYEDVFEHKERRHNARALKGSGWTLFGLGLGTFVLSRVLTPVSCDLVNSCDLRALEATWYVSFALVAAGAAMGTFGTVYGDRAGAYEHKRIAITPMLDRTRAGLGISGRF
jgi:hypothetical protein